MDKRAGDRPPLGVQRSTKRAELMRRRGALQTELFELEQRLDELSESSVSEPAPRETGHPASFGRGRPLRATMIDALEDLGCMAYSRELMLFLKATYGREVPPTRFGTLGIDETRAYDSKRPRSVYLCFGLTHDRFEAIKRLWGRSDWELSKRIVAPTTGRVQHLKMTMRLCELAHEAKETAAEPTTLKIIAADHARDLPGVKFKRGDFPLKEWRDLAEKILREVEPRDRERREEAAARLAQRAEREQLFGIQETPLFGVPKSKASAHDEGRSA